MSPLQQQLQHAISQLRGWSPFQLNDLGLYVRRADVVRLIRESEEAEMPPMFCDTCSTDGRITRLHNGACWMHGTSWTAKRLR